MGLLSRLIRRRRGVLSVERDEEEQAEAPRLLRPRPTAGTQRPAAPQETPSMRRPRGHRRTAGTPSYTAPRGTPSTQRIHNPTRPGR